MPRHRGLGEEIRRRVRTLELRVRGLVLGVELAVDVHLLVQFADDEVLVAGLHRERRLSDVALIDAVLRPAIPGHQVRVERDALRIVTGVEVVLAEIVHHLERLVVAPRVAAERLQEVVRLLRVARERVDRDDVAARRDGELLGVGQLLVLRAVLDRLLELAHRSDEVALVPGDVAELVVRVAPDLVVRRRVLGDLVVRLLRERPLRRVTLRLVEEELPEGQVRVRNVLRLRPALDELEVDLASLLELGRLLVLVREVVEHLVGAARALRRVLRVGVLAPLRYWFLRSV